MVITSYVAWLIADAWFRDRVRLGAVCKIHQMGAEGYCPQNLGRDLWGFAAKSIQLLRQLKIIISLGPLGFRGF